MNRAERRAAKVSSKRESLARDVAIHEAGHAVARILTAKDFGCPPHKCVVRIDVNAMDPSLSNSIDGLKDHQVQATSYGLMFSAEITAFFKNYFPDGIRGYGRADLAERKLAFLHARNSGVAVDKWIEARLLIDVFGAASESKFLEKPATEIWNSLAAEGDFQEAAIAATMAGLDVNTTMERLSDSLARAVTLLKQDEVWQAVQAVADILPARGSVAGSQIFKVAAKALGPAHLG